MFGPCGYGWEDGATKWERYTGEVNESKAIWAKLSLPQITEICARNVSKANSIETNNSIIYYLLFINLFIYFFYFIIFFNLLDKDLVSTELSFDNLSILFFGNIATKMICNLLYYSMNPQIDLQDLPHIHKFQ